MDVLSAILLSIVQGITEWLPVSSSGHLVIVSNVLGVDSDVFFNTVVHVASLIAVLFVFRREVLKIIRAVLYWQSGTRDFRMFWMLVLASIPIALVGYFFADAVEQAFSSLLVVSISLIVTGTMLYLSKYVTGAGKVKPRSAIIIGLCQAFALIPGISRSGMTISAGVLQGIKREEAATFSFLLYIPAVVGAGVYQYINMSGPVLLVPVIVGLVVTTFVSIIALTWLLRIIKRGRFHLFSWYCWALGLIVLLSQII